MTTHTEGPWFVGEPDKNGQAIIRNKDIEIATCWHHCVGAIEKEMHGNARIFAASLELLEALKEIVEYYPDSLEYEDKQRFINLIAKAEDL